MDKTIGRQHEADTSSMYPKVKNLMRITGKKITRNKGTLHNAYPYIIVSLLFREGLRSAIMRNLPNHSMR